MATTITIKPEPESEAENNDDNLLATTSVSPLFPPPPRRSASPLSPSPSASASASGTTTDDDDDDSDELHETRPNRWRGHPSTWKTWTEGDRRAWLALEGARRGDLAAHLYNAWGLRRGLRRGAGVGGGAGEGLGEQEDHDSPGSEGWNPGKLWTAWPMKADEVPDDGLLPRTLDVNEPLTLRREQGPPFAGTNLEAEISATILRCAKEKFRGRNLQGQQAGDEQVVQSIEEGNVDATATEGETDASGTAGVATGDDEEEDTGAPPKMRKRKRRCASPTFTPVFSADDDWSYALLRPAARRIMARLDDTLMILHNQRVAGLGNMSESSASDGDETDAEAVSKKRETSETPVRKYRGGRPKKLHVPREGETEREMLIRLARENHRLIPRFSPEASEAGEPSQSGAEKSRSVSRGRRSASRSSRATTSQPRKSSARNSSTSTEAKREKRLAQWGLRNWRDVLGAAALAGFPAAVMARAAQRCSTLFGEDITMHTLHEQPATSDKAAVETVRYVPGAPLPSSSDEEDDDDDEAEEELWQLRAVSRQPSVKLGGASSSEAEAETPAARRSRSSTPAPAHFCSYPNCPWAVRGFTKRTNLARHLWKVHGTRLAQFADEDEDSMDEMEGGVHVDGFLKPIKIRKGWRGEDVRQRRPARKRAKRDGSEELGGGGFSD